MEKFNPLLTKAQQDEIGKALLAFLSRIAAEGWEVPWQVFLVISGTIDVILARNEEPDDVLLREGASALVEKLGMARAERFLGLIRAEPWKSQDWERFLAE